MGALLALVGAVVIGAGLARQHAAARAVDDHPAMDPRLLLHLARRRSWLVGVALANAGFVLIAAGIATGHLAVVEPIGATQVLFALLFSARASGRRLGRTEWLAAGSALVGVGGFLVVAAPSHRVDASPVVPWVVPLGVLITLVVVGVVASRGMARASRGVVFAALAGLTFGTGDALIKAISETARAHGAVGVLGHWSLYAWMAAGLTALLLQQSAYHATHLGAAMPATSTLAPTTATLLGAAMLGEQLRGGWAIPAEVALFGLLLVGVARLAGSPVLDDAVAPGMPRAELAV